MVVSSKVDSVGVAGISILLPGGPGTSGGPYCFKCRACGSRFTRRFQKLGKIGDDLGELGIEVLVALPAQIEETLSNGCAHIRFAFRKIQIVWTS